MHMGTHYARSETDRNGERSRDPVRCKPYDARGPALRYGLQRQHVMDQVVHLNQKETAPPFSYLLSDQELINKHCAWKFYSLVLAFHILLIEKYIDFGATPKEHSLSPRLNLNYVLHANRLLRQESKS